MPLARSRTLHTFWLSKKKNRCESYLALLFSERNNKVWNEKITYSKTVLCRTRLCAVLKEPTDLTTSKWRPKLRTNNRLQKFRVYGDFPGRKHDKKIKSTRSNTTEKKQKNTESSQVNETIQQNQTKPYKTNHSKEKNYSFFTSP